MEPSRLIPAPNDQLLAYGIKLTSIIYNFKNGRLIDIAFNLTGKHASNQMQQALLAAYGPGQYIAPLTGPHWQGNRVLLNFNPATEANPTSQVLDLFLN